MNKHTYTVQGVPSRRNASRKRLTGLAAAALAILAILSPAAANAGECPNESLREANNSTGLPDCRAYEKVTPQDKGSATLTVPGVPPISDAASNGERFFYVAYGTFAGTQDGSAPVPYIAARGENGWGTIPLSPADNHGEYQVTPTFMSEDLTVAGFAELSGTFLNPSSSLTTLAGVGPVGGPYINIAETPGYGTLFPDAASADFSHVVLGTADLALTPGPVGVTSGNVLYEWSSTGLRLVAVDNAGNALSACGAVLGNYEAFKPIPGPDVNSISSDGSRIFFRSPTPEAGCPEPPRLYVRENGTTTREVSAPEPGVSDTPEPIMWQGSAKNGSRVFFTTTQKLTADAPEASANSLQLYEYDLDSNKLNRISGGSSHAATGAVGAVLASDDGTTVYFTSTSLLVPGKGTFGEANLYRYDTRAGTYQYVSTLRSDELSEFNYGLGMPIGPTAGTPVPFYTTPDGSTLLLSQRVPGAPPAATRQIFRFSAADGSFVCVSCGGKSEIPPTFASFGVFGYYHHPVSSDGHYVFFTSYDALVPSDVDGAADVYEWHDGVVSLLSSGTAVTGSYFMDASADGRDVFFNTFGSLTPQDGDSQEDVYDARRGGGFPAPSVPAGGCEADACQGSRLQPPVFGVPASTAISSAAGAKASTPVSFRVAPLTAGQRAALARGRRVAVRVTVDAAASVTVRLSAPLGAGGRTILAASGSASSGGAGVLYVHLRLSGAARRALSRRAAVRVRLIARLSGSGRQQVLVTKLTGSHSNPSRRGA